MTELSTRAYRKYQQNGLQSVLLNGWDIAYRKSLLKRFVAPTLLSRTSRPVLDTNSFAVWADQHGRRWDVPTEAVRPEIPTKDVTDTQDGFDSLEHREPPEPFVCDVPNAQLWAAAGLGLTGDGSFIGDTISFQWNLENRLQTALSVVLHESNPIQTGRRTLTRNGTRSRDGPTVDSVCTLVPLWDNYYHWTAESLTKLMGVSLYERETDRSPKLLLPTDPPSWMTESLELLGFGPRRWIQTGADTMQVDHLVVPSFPDPSPEECQWLRQRAYDQLGIDTPGNDERIYVSRSNATRRRIANEADVMSTLEQFGFTSYELEALTVKEQIELFANADIVVGPHGAGLINTIYSSDTTVVELFGDWLKSTFYRIARLQGLEYGYLQCESRGIDLHVDTAELERKLERRIEA
ncbi:glycosyltransferase family 61 protein [Natrinema longum]|nr:glycosyltransferase family 61 protein [Natrinema longum]